MTRYSVRCRVVNDAVWTTEETYGTQDEAQRVLEDLTLREPTNDDGEALEYRILEVQTSEPAVEWSVAVRSGGRVCLHCGATIQTPARKTVHATTIAADGTATCREVPKAPPKVEITLTAYNMGDVTEDDFDQWAAWVGSHVDEACGVDATVDQHRFGGGPDQDTVRGADDETIAAVRQWLQFEGWERWCAEGAPDAVGA